MYIWNGRKPCLQKDHLQKSKQVDAMALPNHRCYGQLICCVCHSGHIITLSLGSLKEIPNYNHKKNILRHLCEQNQLIILSRKSQHFYFPCVRAKFSKQAGK